MSWSLIVAPLALCCLRAQADRTILSPRGLVMAPSALQLELSSMATGGHSNYQWLTLGTPSTDLGLEVEGERVDVDGRARATFSVQYSLTGNALSDIAPAVSVGLRDVLNAGLEGRAAFLAVTKTVGLSEAQERSIRGLMIHAGYGSSRMDGAFASAEIRFRPGFTVSAEYLARRVNAEIAVPLGSYLRLRAYSLNGHIFYGASLTVRR